MTNGNDPAFARPAVLDPEDGDRVFHGAALGLTKREHFAALAMQGYCANPDPQTSQAMPKTRANWAILEADALIVELNKLP